MTIKIITIGNKSSPPHQSIIDEYMKRFPRNISIDWQCLKHGSGTPSNSKQQESESILNLLSEKYKVILLDEIGKQMSSPQLSKKLFGTNQDVCIIIGGAYGVSETVLKRADTVWSLSDLVFPHQLVRVILAEQIYRAYTISINHPYHHS